MTLTGLDHSKLKPRHLETLCDKLLEASSRSRKYTRNEENIQRALKEWFDERVSGVYMPDSARTDPEFLPKSDRSERTPAPAKRRRRRRARPLQPIPETGSVSRRVKKVSFWDRD